MKLNASSEAKLARVRGELAKVIRRAAALSTDPAVGFVVTTGLRSVADQRLMVAKGASKTMRSRHLPGKVTGLAHAVDLAVTINGKLRWDWPLYAKLAAIVKRAARDVGVPVEWGGDWKSFKDGPHFQLPWDKFPG